MRIVSILPLAMCVALLGGCGSEDKPLSAKSAPPEASETADGIITAEGSASQAAMDEIKSSLKTNYNLKPIVVHITEKDIGTDTESVSRTKLIKKVCGKPTAGFVQVTILDKKYLEKSPWFKVLNESNRSALVVATSGDGKYMYQAYPETLIGRYNLNNKSNQTPAQVRYSCSKLAQ